MDFYDDAKVKFIIPPQAANCFQRFDEWVSIDSRSMAKRMYCLN